MNDCFDMKDLQVGDMLVLNPGPSEAVFQVVEVVSAELVHLDPVGGITIADSRVSVLREELCLGDHFVFWWLEMMDAVPFCNIGPIDALRVNGEFTLGG